MNAQTVPAADAAKSGLTVVAGGKVVGTKVARPVPRPAADPSDVNDAMTKGATNMMKAQAARAADAEDDKKKQEALDAKNTEDQLKAIKDAEEQGALATSLMEEVVKQSQEIVRLQFAYKKAGPGEQDKLKNQALAIGVTCLENVEKALAPLRSSKSALLGRLKSVFEWESPFVHQLVKERKKPKAQFELDLQLSRDQMTLGHRICEENGAPRISDEPKKKTGIEKASADA